MAITVTHGANTRKIDCAGTTIGELKKRLKEVFNIAPDASAWLNGVKVGEGRILCDDDNLEFVKADGLKSSLHDLWSSSEVEQLFGQEALGRMMAAGLEFKMHMGIKSHELIHWAGWFARQKPVPKASMAVSVNIEREMITVDGEIYPIDKQMAAVIQCLLEARGERRSCQDMRNECPQYVHDERLDKTIKRRLGRHTSGIGRYIVSDKRGYRLVLPDCAQ